MRKPPESEKRKRIGILTFHRCINYGAFWQMRCLADFFIQAGHDVEVLDYRSGTYFSSELRHALRPHRPAPRRDVIALLAKTFRFLRAQQGMKRTPMFSLRAPPDFSGFDLIAVGSDEVWNLQHPWLGGVPLFFGETLAPKRLVSYAASFGSYSAANGLPAQWVERLRRFDSISVRDANSMNLVERHLGSAATLVLDPCLQFTPRPGSAPQVASRAPYLLVYGNHFTPQLIEETRRWARSRRLRIVSIGYRNEWADVSELAAGPDDFVHAFQGAQAVVTSYLHGCIFSLQFNRPFAVQLSDYRTNKISGLLGLLNATHRIYDPQHPGRLANLLSTPVEPEILCAVQTHRTASLHFLDSCLR